MWDKIVDPDHLRRLHHGEHLVGKSEAVEGNVAEQEQQENCCWLKSQAGELDKSRQKVIKDEEEGATVRWWRWVGSDLQ